MADLHITPDGWEPVVAETDGPQLIVAGPGTGKTEFLVQRATHLINDQGLSPEQLLILTFSRRAAADLRDRVAQRLQRSTTGVPASTFHSFAFRLLEAEAPTTLGWQTMPTLLTGPEQVGVVADLLESEPRDAWPLAFREMLGSRTFAEEVADFVMRSQERLYDADALATRAARRDDWRRLPAFLRRYHDHLRDGHRIDYGTLQAQAVRLLNDLEVRAHIADQYHYVLVDEYQDTTVAQAALLEGLTAVRRNLTVAADPHQSVYSFRGAELANVAEFTERFRALDSSPARRIVLDTSFRVPSTILTTAAALIPEPVPGSARAPQPAPHTGRVDVHVFDQSSHEADWIASEVQRVHLTDGVALDAIAILVRTKRRILSELSRALDRRGIDHDKPDSRLVDHPAVRIVFDCVELADAASQGSDAAATRLILGPLFGLTISRQRELLRIRHRGDASWSGLFRQEVDGGEALADLLDTSDWATEMPATEGFWHLWTTLPQFARLVEDPALNEHRSAWTSLSQTLARLHERDPDMSLRRYTKLADADDFEATPMLSYRSSRGPQLTLTTLHQAKGLEFDVVFIADAAEGVFPDLRRRRSILQTEQLSMPANGGNGFDRRERLLEEMRLAYTAMTRARRRVIWTATDAGLDEGDTRPSRFIGDLARLGIDVAASSDDRRHRPPVSIAEAEALLRAAVADPAASPAARLAAASVLIDRPHPGLRNPEEFALMRRQGPMRGVLSGPLRLSPSQAEAYETCPRRYVLERRLGIGGSASVYMSFGSLIHRVLELVERRASGDGQRSTLEEALAELDHQFDGYDFGPGAWRDSWRRRAERCLTTLYAQWPRPDDRAVLLEHHLSLELGGAQWRGIADRIETAGAGRLRIVDYKTGTNPPTQPEAKESLQLGFYLLAAAQDPAVRHHGDPVEAEYWFPMKSSRPDRPIPVDPDRLDEISNRLVATAEAMAAEDWTPRPNQRCKNCSVRLLCPEWPEGREAFVR